jgi:hypothetical protein
LFELARAGGRWRAALCFAHARLALADEGQVPADKKERLRCNGLARGA